MKFFIIDNKRNFDDFLGGVYSYKFLDLLVFVLWDCGLLWFVGEVIDLFRLSGNLLLILVLIVDLELYYGLVG